MTHFGKYMGRYMSRMLFFLFILDHLHNIDRRRKNKFVLREGASYTELKLKRSLGNKTTVAYRFAQTDLETTFQLNVYKQLVMLK